VASDAGYIILPPLAAAPGAEQDTSWMTPPTWIPLKSGAVFICLDNVFVVTASKHIADAIFNNLFKNAWNWKCIFKLSGIVDYEKYFTGIDPVATENAAATPWAPEDDARVRIYKTVKAQCFRALAPGATTTIKFFGVNWGATQFELCVAEAQRSVDFLGKWLKTTATTTATTKTTWTSTRKTLSSIVGILGWWRRVMARDYINDTAAAFAMLDLCRHAVPDNAQIRANWNQNITIDDEKLIAALIKMWTTRGRERFKPHVSVNTDLSTEVRVVVDASMRRADDGNATVGKIAAVVLSPNGATFARSKPLDVASDVVSHHELAALRLGVQFGREMFHAEHARFPALVVICSDNNNVVSWCRASGPTKPSHVVIDLIKKIMQEAGKSRIFVARVSTSDNVADAYTRNFSDDTPPLDTALRASQAATERASREAHGVFSFSGGIIGSASQQAAPLALAAEAPARRNR
jgi:hypothetical protein